MDTRQGTRIMTEFPRRSVKDRTACSPEAAVLLAAAILACTSCSTIEKRHYYVPSAEGGVTHRHKYVNEKPYGGPPDQVAFSNAGVRLTVYVVTENLSLATIGPPFLPILPAFPANWFADAWHPLPLKILLRFDGERIRLRFKPADLKIAGAPPVRATVSQPDLMGENDVEVGTTHQADTPSFLYLRLHYDVDPEKTRAFDLEGLNRFSLDGKPLGVPTIHFEQGAGWRMAHYW
jgi:hypothetical protein